VTQLVFDKQLHRFPAFSGDAPIRMMGATILPQSLWVIAGAVAVFIALWLFFTRTLTGRAVLATANNRLAAQLVGINTNWVMTLAFGLSAAIGALAGVLVTPITFTSYDVGIALALKGFAAAMLGGMGNPKGALVGGILLGLVCGYSAYRLMLSIDDYKVEVLVTVALVMGGYSLAGVLAVSGPIAVVVAGILIGNRGREFAMSPMVADYVEKLWEMIDEILNALLFLLIGIEVLVVRFTPERLLAGAIIIGIVLVARFVSVWIPVSIIGLRNRFPRGVVRILTWAGLRGGISVALALSLPPSPERGLILTSTYMVVLFSILVQGMTIRKVLRRYLEPVPKS